jgi:hypothetical protein
MAMDNVRSSGDSRHVEHYTALLGPDARVEDEGTFRYSDSIHQLIGRAMRGSRGDSSGDATRRMDFLHSRGEYNTVGRRWDQEPNNTPRGLAADYSMRRSTGSNDVCLGFAKLQRHVGSSIQIKHWQLRDLVRCPFERDDVFVVKGFAIYRYDIANQKVVDRHGFLFEPTCFGFGGSYLGVAGEVSEYAVQGVQPAASHITQQFTAGRIQHHGSLRTGGHVNNAIKITHDLDGRLSAFLCNNSGHLMVMAGVDQEGQLELSERSSIFCPVSINHCAVSERERNLVYVGDSEEVHVCRATPTGYRNCCTFREASDAGMSCDWCPSGNSFAVASQDGLVCVWDRRQKQAAARIPCRSAARCVKFSPRPLDLLAFTEHRNYLHLVDCRMWEGQQTIKVRDDSSREFDICGFDFSPCGSTLYVGTEDAIDILQIDSGNRTSFPFSKLA